MKAYGKPVDGEKTAEPGGLFGMLRISFVHLSHLQPPTMKWIAAPLLLLAFACTNQTRNGYNRFLQSCNRVDILVFNGGDTLFFDTQDSTGIRILASQITGNLNNVKDTCPAQGLLRFRQDSVMLLEAVFAVTPGKAEVACNYAAYTYDDASHVQGLSDRAKKLLGTVMQQVKQ